MLRKEKSIKEENRGKSGVYLWTNQPTTVKIEVTDLKLNTKTTYDSMHAAAKALNIDNRAISNYFNRNQIKPYKGSYILKKT